MANELGEVRVNVNEPARLEIADQWPGPALDRDISTLARQREVDAVFTQDEREAELVAAWMSMWAGALVLKDVVKESVAEPPDDENQREEKPRAEPHDGHCC